METHYFAALASVVLLIALGIVLRRIKFLNDTFWRWSTSLVYFILFPALIFSNLSSAQISFSVLKSVNVAIGATILISSIAAIAYSAAAKLPHSQATSVFQAFIRFNTFVGIAVLSALLGPEHMTDAIAIASIMIIYVNILSVIVFMKDASWRMGVKSILANPLLIACALGFSSSIFSFELAPSVIKPLKFLGEMSIILGLVTVGAALQLQNLLSRFSVVWASSAFKLLTAPIIAFAISSLMALPYEHKLVLTVFAALPTAPSSFALSEELGGDSTMMAQLIGTQTLFSIVTLPFVLTALALLL